MQKDCSSLDASIRRLTSYFCLVPFALSILLKGVMIMDNSPVPEPSLIVKGFGIILMALLKSFHYSFQSPLN